MSTIITEKIFLDGHEVKVGDRLYCLLYGWGTVDDINFGRDYPLFLNLGEHAMTYTASGEHFLGQGRVLYWDELKITPPPKPGKKVKKYQWLMRQKDGSHWVTTNLHTEEDARVMWGDKVVRPIEETLVEVLEA